MGTGTLPSTLGGALTPVCSSCGVALCWNISLEEYAERPEFWDSWICQDCNGGTPYRPNQKRAMPLTLLNREDKMSTFEVYKAIAAVTAALAKEGISKARKNQQQGFQYRGIDDCYNALAPFLSEAKLCILPRMVSKKDAERTSAKGGILFYTEVGAEFDFVSAIDGSKHTVGPIYGEAFDSGDKSIGKAMSYAYKAMAFMTFAIPTEGDNDPDAQTHDVQPRQGKATPVPTQAAAPPKLSATQTKLFPIVKASLDTLFGDDVAAKKKEIHAISGVEDYRKLDGNDLKDLAHKLQLTVEASKPGELPL